MTGTASSQMVSAFVAESTAGTIPSTPSFTTSHKLIEMAASPEVTTQRSQVAGGARMGHGIRSIPVSGSISETGLIYGVYDTWLETLLQGAWSSNVLSDAKAVSTVSVENKFPAGVGGTDTMLRFRGVEATGGTMRLAAGEDAQIGFSLVGMGSDDATTSAIAGATYTDPTEADPLSSGTDVGTITFDGYTLDCMQSLDIEFTYENRETQGKISSDDMCGTTRGSLVPTLTANMYVESNFLALYNAARDRDTTGFLVTVPIGSVSGEKYTLEFHNCFFGAATIDFTGTSLMQSVTILPAYDETEDCVVTVTRAVS